MILSAWESSLQTSPSRKRAVKRMSDYSLGEKVEMIRQVTVDARAVKDVAHDHSLKPCILSHLICKAKKDKNYITTMLEKEEENVHHRKIVIEAVYVLSEDEDQIASARVIRQHILEHKNVKLSERFIISVLKDHLKLKFCRIRE